MELIDGVDVLTWVCGDSPGPALEEVSTAPLGRRRLPAPGERAPSPRYDEARLRAALGQMAHALSYLHDAGKVHRDIKPSNTLVTDAGRVVLLDFGVVADLTAGRRDSGPILGTEAFMAPEVMERRVGPEADWYSFGVLLYRMLTGRLPAAHVNEVLERARLGLPHPSPRALAPEVPRDLDDLCHDLLFADPSRRPIGPAGARAARRRARRRRDGAAARLRRARARARSCSSAPSRTCANGETLVALVEGESGVGKSALLRELGRRLPASRALVLGGRCYERESVPYKAVDEVIDLAARAPRRPARGGARRARARRLAAGRRAVPVAGAAVRRAAAGHRRARPRSAEAAPARVCRRARALAPAVAAPPAGPRHRRSAVERRRQPAAHSPSSCAARARRGCCWSRPCARRTRRRRACSPPTSSPPGSAPACAA